MRGLSLHVIFRRILFFIVILASFSTFAQRKKSIPPARKGSSIINDSAKSVYGPKSTQWTTEKDLFENRPNYRPLDTTITNYHRWTYVQRFNNTYKDLGVMGTALNSIFPTVPGSIGASAGFSVYQPYFDTEEPHYFDTKSPYTKMRIIWGGKGRNMTRIEFSRNINPRWNMGFDYRPVLVEKQIQSSGKADRIVVSHYYDFYTTYGSKNKRYFLLANFRRIRHRVNENGGVTQHSPDSIFDVAARLRFSATKSEEFRRNIHLLQHYQLVKAFQIYHSADFSKQTNSFTDDKLKDPDALFDYSTNLPGDSIVVNDQTTFLSMQQEAGIKGNAAKLFYSAHYRFRTFAYSNPKLSVAETTGVEHYLGGTVSLQLDSLSKISGAADYLFGGYYNIEAQIQSPWLEGSFKNSLSKPGFMQMYYRGGHDNWNQTFAGVSSTQAQGFLKYRKGRIDFRGGATFSLLNNYVYFRYDSTNVQKVLPYQSKGIQSTFSPEIRMDLEVIRHVYFRPQVIYTSFLSNDDNALRIPELFFNGQLAYENSLFTKHIYVHAGVDFHWHSDYKALGYDPVIQQFYVQNATVSQAFPLMDVFFTGKMGRTRFFFKYLNIFQALKGTGYLPTPNYPGTRNVFDFGFEFLLFD